MRKILFASLLALVVAGVNVGCDKNKSEPASSGEAKKMSTDACAMCPGEQTANAAGKCAKCGM
jgi:hypothetical protein